MRRLVATVLIVVSAVCLMLASKLCPEALAEITEGVRNGS